MAGLTILIANATLATLTGTETYVRDLALGLLRKGHNPIVYAPELGPIAEELQRSAVPVVDNLSGVDTVPYIIHGNHNTETMTALLQFENVPAIFFCHSSRDWVSSPPSHPRILAYVAVDDACRDRLVVEHAIPAERVSVRLHEVDLERFRSREPLPERPRRALVFSNYASPWTHLNAVRQACQRTGIHLDVIGSGAGNSELCPESILGNYDLVFAKARCALEAAAVGTAVVLCDAMGSGPLVTSAEFDRLRRLNFGIRALNNKVSADVLENEIKRYEPKDAAEVSRRVREGGGVDSVVDDALIVYNKVIAEFQERTKTDPAAENRATADYLRWLTLTTRRNQTEYEAMFANSLSIRLRNRIGRFPLVDKLLDPLAQIARRNGD